MGRWVRMKKWKLNICVYLGKGPGGYYERVQSVVQTPCGHSVCPDRFPGCSGLCGSLGASRLG